MDKLKRMQLGRRAAYLRKCILAQKLLAEYEDETSVRRRVFGLHIKPVVFCSYVQFNNMLNERNPEKELRDIEVKLNN
jgi:hypothetical protein